ncbi:AAA family ATPase [Streptomyces sp. WA1-19]|uniref:ATP-binding protein n=1 Tax=Streptomyces sp. WA1-19 TaxID=2884220 RepID=UPI001D04A45A|nr:ATP-binding protein [Streptomyces sp. WA1-19]UDF06676.1 AAA family ATPase [Streptomyces sp. WA1-19]
MARPSLQDLIRRRRQGAFVGREQEIELFARNLDGAPSDPTHRFLFHVYGVGGVGKSTLVREWERLAVGRGALTAYVDDSVHSVPEVMAVVAEQFARQGRPLKALEKRLEAHRRRVHEALAASGADAGGGDGAEEGASAVSSAVVRAGLVGVGMVPGVGAFAPVVDGERLARGADRFAASLSARFRDQDDVRLVLDPLPALSPVLLAELGRVAEEVPWTALFFDTYENTAPFLDAWLRDLTTTDRYGQAPGNLVLTLAGRNRPDRSLWGGQTDLVAHLPLEPLTENETGRLLDARGIHDEDARRAVWEGSAGLPVLVTTLADHPGDTVLAGATAVDRFLGRDAPPGQREAALACALPRTLDEDVCAAATEEPGDPAALFASLTALPFVSGREGAPRYHDVVRAPMLHLRRTTAPARWRAAHLRLAALHERRYEELGGAGGRDEADPARLHARLEAAYHRLCAHPATALPELLAEGAAAARLGAAPARRWARTLADAGRDNGDAATRGWGADCLAVLDEDDGPKGRARLAGLLVDRPGLVEQARAEALYARAALHREAGALAKALADYDRLDALRPGDWRTAMERAVAHRQTGAYAAALAHLDEAESRLAADATGTEPDPASLARLVRERGETRRHLGQFEEAVTLLGRALDLAPGDPGTLVSRASAHLSLGRPELAVADLDQALGARPDHFWALLKRARTHDSLGDREAALADLARAAELAQDPALVIGERAEIHRRAGEHTAAVVAFGEAIAADPGYLWAYGGRAMAHHALGDTAAAVADLRHALSGKPDYLWARLRLAEIHHEQGSCEAEFAEYDEAVAATGGRLARPYVLRAQARAAHGEHERAVEDFDRALRIEPGDERVRELAEEGARVYVAASAGETATEPAAEAPDATSWRRSDSSWGHGGTSAGW